MSIVVCCPQRTLKQLEREQTDTLTHTLTHTHVNYRNPRACAPRVNYYTQVDVTDGSMLPVRLAAFWKCTELITNFRFDYSYISSHLPPSSGPTRPPLTQMTVCVPVNGGVRNTLSRPSGNWLSDKQQITWKIGEVAPGDSESEC